MHRIARRFVFVAILLTLTLVPYSAPAHASAYTRIPLPGTWFADVTFCTDGFYVVAGGDLLTGVTTTVSVLSANPASTTGPVLTFTGPGSASGSAFFGWQNPQKVGKAASVTLDRSEDGLSLTGGTGRIGYGLVEDCVLTPYAGPPLPPPGGRNLVLVVADTPILDAPGGLPTGDMLNTCQTAFVIGTNNGYGEIFIMGGWINLTHTVDVAEDYGQPGGAPVVPGCTGR